MYWRANLYIFGLVLRLSAVSPINEIISEDEVQHLIGEPDFRDVLLHWEYDNENEEKAPKVLAFQIHYCEVQAWGQYRCRNKVLDATTLERSVKNSTNITTTIAPYTRQGRTYTTRITGLRMATTYSFEVRPVKRDARDLADPFSISFKNIIVPTKGFSARATQCLPHASEVEVSTGPYFGGRIAVEAANGGAERCYIQGNPNSAQDAYILRINHNECGSVVNETTVATYVLVQENLPILTHSTRRFLVLCTYKPETLTVRAGINLPRTEVVKNVRLGSIEPFSIEDEDDSEDVEYNEVKASRLQAEKEQEAVQNSGPFFGEIALVMLMVVIIFIVIGVLIWKVTSPKDNDNISIVTASSLSRLGIFKKNSDRFSDTFSVYSISLSEKEDGFPKKRSDVDNTSEA